MGFVTFAGRVFFASVFILSAFQEFNEYGVDGGPAAKALRPKYELFTKLVSSHLGIQVPEIEMRHVIAATIAAKGLGGLLFIFSSSFGAYLLLSIISIKISSIFMGWIVVKSLPFKVIRRWILKPSSRDSEIPQLVYLALVTPIVHDFYNYDFETPVFMELFIKFTQNLSLFGALLYYLGMKHSVPKRLSKKKNHKSKTV